LTELRLSSNIATVDNNEDLKMKLKELKDLISKIEKENGNNLDDCEVFISDSDHTLMELENAIIGHHPLSTIEKQIYLTVD
jgi:hypothetical protein